MNRVFRLEKSFRVLAIDLDYKQQDLIQAVKVDPKFISLGGWSKYDFR